MPSSLRLRVLAGVDEVGLLDGGEVAALAEHRLEEQHGALLELPHAVAQLGGVPVQLDHVLQAVHADQRLLGRVHRGDVVVVPGHVAALVRRDGALDVGAGQAADQRFMTCDTVASRPSLSM